MLQHLLATHLKATQRAVQRTGHVGGSLAGGGGERDARHLDRIGTQQRQQLSHRGGFARARPASYQHQRLQHRQRGSQPLPVMPGIGKPIAQPLPQPGVFR